MCVLSDMSRPALRSALCNRKLSNTESKNEKFSKKFPGPGLENPHLIAESMVRLLPSFDVHESPIHPALGLFTELTTIT